MNNCLVKLVFILMKIKIKLSFISVSYIISDYNICRKLIIIKQKFGNLKTGL